MPPAIYFPQCSRIFINLYFFISPQSRYFPLCLFVFLPFSIVDLSIRICISSLRSRLFPLFFIVYYQLVFYLVILLNLDYCPCVYCFSHYQFFVLLIWIDFCYSLWLRLFTLSLIWPICICLYIFSFCYSRWSRLFTLSMCISYSDSPQYKLFPLC